MITPLKRPFERMALGKRLESNVNAIRQAVAERAQTDSVLDPQREKLESANNVIMAAVDEIVEILTVWNVGQTRNAENSDVMADAVNALADTGTLIQNVDVFDTDPARILSVMIGAPEAAARAAIAQLDPETLKKWQGYFD